MTEPHVEVVRKDGDTYFAFKRGAILGTDSRLRARMGALEQAEDIAGDDAGGGRGCGTPQATATIRFFYWRSSFIQKAVPPSTLDRPSTGTRRSLPSPRHRMSLSPQNQVDIPDVRGKTPQVRELSWRT